MWIASESTYLMLSKKFFRRKIENFSFLGRRGNDEHDGETRFIATLIRIIQKMIIPRDDPVVRFN